MKKLSMILLLLFAVLATSCGIYGNYGFNYEQLSLIERGMDFKKVCSILGEPAFRDLDEDGEAWMFRALGTSGWSVVKVWFKEGKVTELKSYLEDTYPTKRSTETNHFEKKNDTTSKDSGTKVYVSPEGKHYVKMGSVVVTPEGKHIIVPN